MKIKIILVLLLTDLLIIGCKKNKYTQISNTQIKYNKFCEKIEANYAFWLENNINWDSIKSTSYKNFEKLDLNNPEDQKRSVKYFKAMVSKLIDGHFNITFSSSLLRDSIINPRLEILQKNTNFHNPFPYIDLDTLYLNESIKGVDITNQNQSILVICGSIKDHILYFYCSSMNLSEFFYTTKSNQIKPVLDYYLKKISNPSSTIDKVIFDFRGNPGGSLGDLDILLGPFITTPKAIFGYTRYKTGYGRLDYTPWIPAYIHSSIMKADKKIKLIALTDIFTASAAEATILALKSLKGTIIGENTYGAISPVSSENLLNSGSFVIPNLMHVQMASAAFKYIDGKMYESIGIKPDKEINFNKTALFVNKKDLAFEAAINF